MGQTLDDDAIVHHFVQIDARLCNGCVLCMRACPMKAIRVRDGRLARIEGVCVHCGRCIRVCPQGAIKVRTTGTDVARLSPHTIISVSSLLYTQFGADVMPIEVLLALRRIFKHVHDQAYAYELFNIATEFYIREARERGGVVWPLISPICPVVNRVIAHRFPYLLTHILPIMTPGEIAARELKKRLAAEKLVKAQAFKVYNITPCSARMSAIEGADSLSVSYLNGALGINEIYDQVKKNIQDMGEDIIIDRFTGIVGLGWGITGGEIAGLDEVRSLAVSGIHEVMRYLEKIEMGLFSDVEYFEFRACREGCVAGPMTVVDRYEAKRTLQSLVGKFGQGRRLRYPQAKRAYDEGWFFAERKSPPPQDAGKKLPIAQAIERQRQVEQVFEMLPRKECGACGSPDCRTFAEDVADGRAGIESCPLVKRSTGKEVVR